MKILHTSDWHLGHLLLDLPREREHQVFLAWLLDVLEHERIDALLVTRCTEPRSGFHKYKSATVEQSPREVRRQSRIRPSRRNRGDS